MTWVQPPDRFDSDGVRLLRKSGSAPTSETDGTQLLDQSTATSFNEAPGSGTFFYGLLGMYDEKSGQRFSPIRTIGPFVIV